MIAKNQIGRTIAGKYRLDALVGEGGFGAVYRAIHEPLGRTVAVKICQHGHRVDLHERFVREARIQSALCHPACVTLLDFGEDDGLFYMVQEFVEGRTLAEILRAEGPLPVPRAAAVIGEVLDLLDVAHRLGIVHRDIKPANIMLTGIGERVRVLDFGIAKLLDDDSAVDLTRTGATVGTPSFMAPEQIRRGSIGPATDIYAVGATLYRLCAGRGPFVADAPFDVLRMQLEARPPALPFEAPVVDAVIARAMAKDPRARFPTAAAMRAALTALDPDATYPSLPPLFLPAPTDTTTVHGERSALDGPARPRTGVAVLGALALVVSLIALLLPREPGGADRGADTPQGPAGARAATMAYTGALAHDPSDAAGVEAADADPPADAEADALVIAAPPIPIAKPRPRSVRRARKTKHATRPPTKTRARSGAVARSDAQGQPSRGFDRPGLLVEQIERHLLACRCAAIPGPLEALRRLDAPRAEKLRPRFEDECRARLPNNCLERAGR